MFNDNNSIHMSGNYPFLRSVTIGNTDEVFSNKFASKTNKNGCTTLQNFNLNGLESNLPNSDYNYDCSEYKSDDISENSSPKENAKDCYINKGNFCDSSISGLSSLSSISDISQASIVQSTKNENNDQNVNRSNMLKVQRKPNLLNHISNFMSFRRKKDTTGHSSIRSTTCLILNDRPSGLPPKDPEECKRHNMEYKKLLDNIKKREQQMSHENKAKEKSRLDYEERQCELTNVWRNLIIPNWEHQRDAKFVRHLWWEGIPTSVRDKVWCLCIPNELNLTASHYENFASQMLERLERYSEVTRFVNDATVTSTNLSDAINTEENDLVHTFSKSPDEHCQNMETPNHSSGVSTRRVHNNSNCSSHNRDSRSSVYSVYISEPSSLYPKRSSGAFTTASVNNAIYSGSSLVGQDVKKEKDERCYENGSERTLDTEQQQQQQQQPYKQEDEDELRQALVNTIKLDVSRTFPQLHLFQEGGPNHNLLHQLLGAYVCYRPDIGYVQGMSFLAAVLLLVVPRIHDAFIIFANVLEMPCHNAFYSFDESQFLVHIETFKVLLLTYLPQLSQHFSIHHLDVNMFLCDWLFTIFSRALSLDTALRVWDIFCRDGEVTLYRAALAILRCYEMQLLSSDFEEMASFLTGQMPDSLTPNVLVQQMRAIPLSRKEFRTCLLSVQARVSSLKKQSRA